MFSIQKKVHQKNNLKNKMHTKFGQILFAISTLFIGAQSFGSHLPSLFFPNPSQIDSRVQDVAEHNYGIVYDQLLENEKIAQYDPKLLVEAYCKGTLSLSEILNPDSINMMGFIYSDKLAQKIKLDLNDSVDVYLGLYSLKLREEKNDLCKNPQSLGTQRNLTSIRAIDFIASSVNLFNMIMSRVAIINALKTDSQGAE